MPLVISAASLYRQGRAGGVAMDGWGAFVSQAPLWYPLILITPAISALTERVGIGERRSLFHVPLYLGTAAVISFLFVVYLLGVELFMAHGRAGLELLPGAITGIRPGLLFPYFLTCVLLTITGLAAQYYVKHNEQQALLGEMRLKALRAQIRPHFLFNTLNAISGIVESDPRVARDMIADLSDLLRVSLVSDDVQEVRLEEELNLARSYLNIEQKRFSDRMSVTFDIDPRTLSVRVPHLLLQPLIENAVRHGLSRSLRPGRIVVRAALEEGRLNLRVVNTGPALDKDSILEGVGLSNSRRRLRQLYGERSALSLSKGPQGGCEVRVEIPLSGSVAG